MAYQRWIQYNMFDEYFQSSLDPDHRLVLLTARIEWDRLTEALLSCYSCIGRRAKSIHLMVGLLILKHLYNLSDEQVVAGLHENLYWVYFYGLSWSVDMGPPHFVESSTLTKFRRRVGEGGMAEVEPVIREQLIDTTAMVKDIAFPTDSGLLHRGIGKLAKGIRTVQRLGVAGGKKVRNCKQVSKRALVEISKLGKDRKDRIEQNTLKLAIYAREVAKRVPQILQACEEHLKGNAAALGSEREAEAEKIRLAIERPAGAISEQDVLKRMIHQSAEERFRGHHAKDKVYSLHEPLVSCIRRGKRSKPDEYGSKVLFSVDRKGYVVAHREYPSNPADSELLVDAVRDWQRAFSRASPGRIGSGVNTPVASAQKQVSGKAPKEAGADRGFHRASYEGEVLKEVDRLAIPQKEKTPHPEANRFWFKLAQGRRAAEEPIIGHLKKDHRMDQCQYKGFERDTINVCLASIAWNLMKWSRALAAA